MTWYGDPEALEASARRLAADAEGVRERGHSLVASVRALPWRGPAAEAFHRAVGDDADALHRAARELDEAAAELRAHAAQVRERLARLRELADAATGWVDDVWDAVT